MAKSKSDIERDKSKIDPWKVIHFEPVWGIRKDCQMEEVNPADSEYGPLVDEVDTSHIRSPLPKPEVPKTEFEIRNEKRKERRKRLAALAAAEAEAKKKSKNSSNKDVKNEEEGENSDSDENQPLIKKIKSDPNQNDYQKQAVVTTSDDKKPKAEIEDQEKMEKEKVKFEKTEEIVQPELILEEVQDEVMEEEGVVSERDGATPTSPKLETVIEEPVSLIEEDDNSISDPPLRSCSVDQEAEVVSIPPSPPPMGVPPAGFGGVASQAATPSPTPPTLSVTPIPISAGLPAEFMANMSDTAMNIPSVSSTIVASSPASIRSARGNSITFSSSR